MRYPWLSHIPLFLKIEKKVNLFVDIFKLIICRLPVSYVRHFCALTIYIAFRAADDENNWAVPSKFDGTHTFPNVLALFTISKYC